MNKTTLVILTTIVGLLGSQTVFSSEVISKLPSETILLKLPDGAETKWKENNREISEKMIDIHLLPSDQSYLEWSDMMYIQYFDLSLFELAEEKEKTIENVSNILFEQGKFLFPTAKPSIKMIEKNINDATYEIIVDNECEILPKHDLIRIFLSKTAVHRIGFSKNDSQMTTEEREENLKLLKENASIIPYEKAINEPGLSIVNKVKYSLNLGPFFQDWIISVSLDFDDGSAFEWLGPPTRIKDNFSVESLKITTIPTYDTVSYDIDTFYEEVKKKLLVEIPSAKIEILKKSDKEIIYSYQHHMEILPFYGMTRIFLRDQGTYHIDYNLSQFEQISQTDISQIMKKLESVTTKL